ncbi:MAG: hypothetical protein FJ206_11425 [Gemmatimonadetes bacterium]|nr:hypothetical protein [Gemmatimonadota bacterium]
MSKKKAAPPPKNPNQLYAILAGLAVVGAGIIYYLVKRPQVTSIPIPATIVETDTAGFRGYLIGSPDAKVEITEYADFQCPACQTFDVLQFDVVKRQLVDSGIARFRYRDFPLDQIHPHARLASHAAACADEQGKFWEMKTAIYDGHGAWSAARSAAGPFREYAGQVGLDLGKYDDCMSSKRYAGRIEASLQEGLRLGVSSTPTFLIGRRLYTRVGTSDSLAAIVRRVAADSTL